MKTIKQKLFEIFEEQLPAYYKTDSIRTSQVQMAFDIADFLQSSNQNVCIVEAPVGTGKSLGALIPSLLNINKDTFSNEKIVYATATINLQNQIMNSEAPLLKGLSLLKKPILAMGKSHYYCHERFLFNKDSFSIEEQDVLNDFFIKSSTGTRNELEKNYELDFPDQKWEKVELLATKRECSNCFYSDSCSTNNQRSNFHSDKNDLIVTNHDQYIVSVINILSERNRSPIIPVNTGILIIDEAHHFIDNFLSKVEESFTIKHLKTLPNQMHKDFKSDCVKSVKRVENRMKRQQRKFKKRDSLQGRYPVEDHIVREFKKIRNYINESINKYESMSVFRSYSHENKLDTLEEWFILLNNILDQKYVKWIDYEELKISAISNSFPSDFRRMMNYIKRNNKVIIMSGTLTADGSFDTVINQWRLRGTEVITKKFDTPFDYKNQALIYVPKDIVDPRSKFFIENNIKIIRSLISMTDGRTLILSTSKEHMNKIWRLIKPHLESKKIDLLIQGKSGTEKLTSQFREDETSVLIGTGSFFSGFSISGSALTSVILTKLPFPVKDDPFLKLVGQGYEEEFFEHIIYPHMVNKLNQAIGRLIRSIDDYGIFTVLDTRVFTSGYGKHIREMLKKQGYKITQSWEEVKRFYKTKTIEGSNAKYKVYNRNLIRASEKLNVPHTRESRKKRRIRKNNKDTKRTIGKGKGVTTKQREFVNELCKKEEIPRITSNKVDDLYKKVITHFYFKWRDDIVQFIREKFPYRNDDERTRLSDIDGEKRKILMPLCTKFNCKGDCSAKSEIKNYLNTKYQPDKITFRKNKGLCRILIEPISILQREEFRPE